MNSETGEVIWFDNKLGFGFIKTSGGRYVYIHYKDIKTECHRYFRSGDLVTYQKHNSSKGLRLRSVSAKIDHDKAWNYAKYNILRKLLKWLTYRNSVRYMWCLTEENRQYVSLIRYYIFRSRLFDVYIHQFLNDDEHIWHDHPWSFLSYTISGRYFDDYPDGRDRLEVNKRKVVYRNKKYIHRVVLEETYKGKVFTVIITGVRQKKWFYYDSKNNKIKTEEYAKMRGMEVKTYKEESLKGVFFPRWVFSKDKPTIYLKK